MAEEKAPARSGVVGDRPSEVRVTFVGLPDGGGHRFAERPAARAFASARNNLVLVAALAALAAVLAVALEGGQRVGLRAGAAKADSVAIAEIAAAYGYPPRCLSVTVSASDPAYARAHVEARGGCARYHGYVNASFHRVDGVWRLVLDEGQLFVPNSRLAPPRHGL